MQCAGDGANGAEVWQKIHSIVDEAAARIGSIPEIRCISEYTDADGVPRKIERSRRFLIPRHLGRWESEGEILQIFSLEDII